VTVTALTSLAVGGGCAAKYSAARLEELLKGFVPVEAENLLQVVALKQLCRSSGVERLEIGPKGAVIAFKDNRFAHPAKLVEFISKRQSIVTLRPDHRLVYRQDWADTKARMSGVKKLMQNLVTIAA